MEVFIEIILKNAGIRFQRHAKTEFGKRPDFLFPGEGAYKDEDWLNDKLRILGSKTSFKDRWRQILTEGDPDAIVNDADVRRLYLGEEFRL